jgi:hypothetical protein
MDRRLVGIRLGGNVRPAPCGWRINMRPAATRSHLGFVIESSVRRRPTGRPQRVENSQQIDRLLRHGPCHRRQSPDRRDGHPDGAQSDPADGALQRDPSEANTQVNELVNFRERRIDDDHARRAARSSWRSAVP